MNRTRTTALSGVLLALAIITLYAGAIFPNVKLSCYALSSLYAVVLILQAGVRAGWIFYVASLILGVILVPDKLFMIPYAICFGLYAIVKYYIERIKKRPLEIALKLLFFNLSFAGLFMVSKELIFGSSSIADMPVYIIFAVLQVVFLAYDYMLSCGILFVSKRSRGYKHG